MDLACRYTAIEGAIRALSGSPGAYPDSLPNKGYPGKVWLWNVPRPVYVVRGAILAELRRHRLWKPAQTPDATSRRLAALVPEAVVPALVDTFCAVGADVAADVLVELAGPLWDLLGEK